MEHLDDLSTKSYYVTAIFNLLCKERNAKNHHVPIKNWSFFAIWQMMPNLSRRLLQASQYNCLKYARTKVICTAMVIKLTFTDHKSTNQFYSAIPAGDLVVFVMLFNFSHTIFVARCLNCFWKSPPSWERYCSFIEDVLWTRFLANLMN